MNYIKPLSQFFSLTQQDANLSATHLSLFMALFQLWNESRFTAQLQITRHKAMQLGRIHSKATYHRAIWCLHHQRYIDYQPSYHPHLGSHISFFPLENSDTSTADELDTRSVNEPLTSSIAIPDHLLSTRLTKNPFNKLYTLNNNTSIINNRSRARDQKREEKINSTSAKNGVVAALDFEKEKSCAKKEKDLPLSMELVYAFFIEQQSTKQQVRRFVDHYSSNGWLVDGKSPMKDWKAAARNWIGNIDHYAKPKNHANSNRAQQLHTNNRNDYSEPL
ncbi:hypothetical protein [Sphingobacterium chungjuense]|uniref:hypothetical protein n=1 Tax=Sphingobacterium chungjuense TaxID=2675553 RepID=UPI00140814A7|nr:hypothetical protein [Sphingobacterium chungjuense]